MRDLFCCVISLLLCADWRVGRCLLVGFRRVAVLSLRSRGAGAAAAAAAAVDAVYFVVGDWRAPVRSDPSEEGGWLRRCLFSWWVKRGSFVLQRRRLRWVKRSLYRDVIDDGALSERRCCCRGKGRVVSVVFELRWVCVFGAISVSWVSVCSCMMRRDAAFLCHVCAVCSCLVRVGFLGVLCAVSRHSQCFVVRALFVLFFVSRCTVAACREASRGEEERKG